MILSSVFCRSAVGWLDLAFAGRPNFASHVTCRRHPSLFLSFADVAVWIGWTPTPHQPSARCGWGEARQSLSSSQNMMKVKDDDMIHEDTTNHHRLIDWFDSIRLLFSPCRCCYPLVRASFARLHQPLLQGQVPTMHSVPLHLSETCCHR